MYTPPGLVLRVPAEAATANVVAMNADFMVRVLKITKISHCIIYMSKIRGALRAARLLKKIRGALMMTMSRPGVFCTICRVGCDREIASSPSLSCLSEGAEKVWETHVSPLSVSQSSL